VAGFVSLKAVKTGLGRQRLAEESKTLAPPTSTVPQGQIFRQCVRGSHAARLTAPAPANREERMSDQRFRRLRAMARAQRCELTKGTWAGAGTVLHVARIIAGELQRDRRIPEGKIISVSRMRLANG
jgi:hypothetical protein